MKRNNFGRNWFVGLISLLFISPVFGASITHYVDTQFGFGRFSRDISDTESQSTWGEFFKAGIGLQAPHTISAGVSARFWGTLDDDEEENEVDLSHTFLHDFHYFGASIAAEVLLMLPKQNQGPFIRYSRQCWSTSTYDLFDSLEREDEGCGNTYGFGMIAGQNGQPGGLVLEIEFSQFDTISSTIFMIGARF